MLPKEMDCSKEDLDSLAEGLGKAFFQRRDMYARQLDDGRYVCIPQPLKFGHLVSHLKGDITLGVYVLDTESCTRFIAIDADNEMQMAELVKMVYQLTSDSIPAYLEASRRGGHLWVFLSQPLPGKIAREFGFTLFQFCGVECMELFPKQDRLQNGPGSLIRLPFGLHRRTGMRYGFITPSQQPLATTLAEQVWLVSNPQTITPEAVEALLSACSIPVKPGAKSSDETNEKLDLPLSTRIKAAISVQDFVSRYVELSPTGMGLCPFHEDHQPSLVVNAQENYWVCFAGCGGGSIIDFWMKWRKCEFKPALRELAQMLLP